MLQSQIYFIYFFFLTHKQLNPQTTKRKPIQSVLIHGMCIFRVRAATAARNWSAELDEKYENAWHSVA